ncbi:MAG: 4Fe-4S binding protein, partial [Treponema sp.]|nr:4Fe-4S binding protein [Treponema sp.]
AGITAAQGINRAEPLTVNFAFTGDSTFFHTGIPGLVNAVYNRANIIAVILDNGTTAMTGSQPHPGTGASITGSPAEKIDIYTMVKAMGIKNIERANPFDMTAAKEAVRRSLDKTGVRVVLFEAPCIMVERGRGLCRISGACTGCRACVLRLGCPAISLAGPAEPASARAGGKQAARAVIDPALCTGCGICAELCASGAIEAVLPEGA